MATPRPSFGIAHDRQSSTLVYGLDGTSSLTSFYPEETDNLLPTLGPSSVEEG